MRLKKKKNKSELPSDADIVAYLRKCRKIDQIIGTLTRAFCADCPSQPGVGCCDFWEDPCHIPQQLLEAQQKECRQNGGDFAPTSDHCGYHTANGCSIPNSKTAICIGHMCDELEQFLRNTHGEKAGVFIKAMHKVGVASMLHAMPQLLENLDKAIQEGTELANQLQ